MRMECCVCECDNKVVSKAVWRQQWCDSHGDYHGEDMCTCSPQQWSPFPKEKALRDVWVKLVNRKDWQPERSQLVCEKHFKDGKPTTEHPAPTKHMGYNLKGDVVRKILSDIRGAHLQTSPVRPLRKRKPPQQDSDFVFDLPKKKPKTTSAKLTPRKAASVVIKEEPNSPTESEPDDSDSEQSAGSDDHNTPDKTPGNITDSECHTVTDKKPPTVKADLFYAESHSEPINIRVIRHITPAKPLCEQRVFCNGCKLRNAEIRKLEDQIRKLEVERDTWQQKAVKLEPPSETDVPDAYGEELTKPEALDVRTVGLTSPAPDSEETEPPIPIIVAPTIDGGSSIIITEKVPVESNTEPAQPDDPADDPYEDRVNIMDFLGDTMQEEPPATGPEPEPNSCIQIRRVRKLKADEAWDLLCGPSPLVPVTSPPFQTQGSSVYLWSKKAEHLGDGEAVAWYTDGYRWKNNGTRIVKIEGDKTMIKRHYKLINGEKNFLRYAFMIKGAEDFVLIQYVGNAPECAPVQHPRRTSYKITRQVDPDRPLPKLGPLQMQSSNEMEEDLPEGSRVLSVVESHNEAGSLEYIVLQDLLPEASVATHPQPSAYIQDYNEPMATAEVLAILQNPDRSKICVYPPHRPKFGTAYLWAQPQDAGAKTDDWSHDGYNWNSLPCTAPVIDGTTVERQFFKPLAGVSGFVRYAYNILGEDGLVFIHYVGDSDCYKEFTPPEDTTSTIQMPLKVLKLVEVQQPSGDVEFSFLGKDSSDGTGVEPYFFYDRPLLLSEAVEFLKDPDMTRVSSSVPFKPKGGTAYMWSDQGNPNLKDDWRCDGYPWKSNALRKFPCGSEVIKKHYFKLLGSDGKGFIKCAYQLGEDSGLVLTTYLGDASLHVPKRHGNCKKQMKEHVRRQPSLIREVKAMCESLGPKAACYELASKIDPGATAAAQPNVLRNRHQVYNHFCAMQKKKQKDFNKAVAENLEQNLGVVIEGDALKNLLVDSTWQNLDAANVKFEFVTTVE